MRMPVMLLTVGRTSLKLYANLQIPWVMLKDNGAEMPVLDTMPGNDEQ